MANLASSEKNKLEKLFRMGNGYVLNFSDRTFREFFEEHSTIDINASIYQERGTSKANRLRRFWAIEDNYTVGRIIQLMIVHDQETCLYEEEDSKNLIEECLKTAQRLLLDTPVPDIEALTAPTEDRDFDTLAQHVREAIEKNQPEAALDRLHTFVTKYIRTLCEPRGIQITRDKPLHSIFGEYVKCLRETGHLEAAMTDRILKSSISILDAFNDVRNNKSLAHDNSILNYEESLLIFNHVASSIRFIKALEVRMKLKSQTN